MPQFYSVDHGAEITVGVCENRLRDAHHAPGESGRRADVTRIVQRVRGLYIHAPWRVVAPPDHPHPSTDASSGRGGTGRIARWPTALRQASRPA